MKQEHHTKRFQWIWRVAGLVTGVAIGLSVMTRAEVLALGEAWFGAGAGRVILVLLGTILSAIIFFFLIPFLIKLCMQIPQKVSAIIADIPTRDIVAGVVGVMVGLLVAFLLSSLIQKFPLFDWLIALICTVAYAVFGLIGWTIGYTRFGEGKGIEWPFSKRRDKKTDDKRYAKPKILDTSVIIDGRIFDICKTGIIEGELVIPGFVLQELRHVSDSADSLKRVRGRRGLDVLNKIQQELDIPVSVDETDYDDIAEVDAKLLRLAQERNGVVITNDFNLNKVAAVQQVPVLNINELANAIKAVVLPGEQMTISVIKEGKEAGQGIAYLDDGTMIVVERGRSLIGETIEAEVTSVLQTPAGRMIFAKALRSLGRM